MYVEGAHCLCPCPLHRSLAKQHFYAVGMWESLTIPSAWSRGGSQLLCRKEVSPCILNVMASLHRCLLSLFFLFNNLITAPDLIFFPQMSLQRFMPMNIHFLLKNRVPFSQGRCSLAAGSGGVPASRGNSERGKARVPGGEERGKQP